MDGRELGFWKWRSGGKDTQHGNDLAHVIIQYPASLLTIIIHYSSNSQAVPFVVDERGLCHVGSCLRRFNQDKEILRGLVDPVVVDGDGHDEVIIQVVRGWDGQPLGHPWEVLRPINLNCRGQLCSNSTMRIFLLLCRLMSTTACSTWLQKLTLSSVSVLGTP